MDEPGTLGAVARHVGSSGQRAYHTQGQPPSPATSQCPAIDPQSSTRNGSPIAAAADQSVSVRAHMHPAGYGRRAMKGTPGGTFTAQELAPDFAAAVADEEPLPTNCAFQRTGTRVVRCRRRSLAKRGHPTLPASDAAAADGVPVGIGVPVAGPDSGSLPGRRSDRRAARVGHLG